MWQVRQDLNPQQTVLETVALPVELLTYVKCMILNFNFKTTLVYNNKPDLSTSMPTFKLKLLFSYNNRLEPSFLKFS